MGLGSVVRYAAQVLTVARLEMRAQVLKSKVASCSTVAGGFLAKDERLQACPNHHRSFPAAVPALLSSCMDLQRLLPYALRTLENPRALRTLRLCRCDAAGGDGAFLNGTSIRSRERSAG